MRITIDKNKITRKLLNSIMQKQDSLFNIFVKISLDQSTPEKLEELKQSFNLCEIPTGTFTMTAPLITISRLLALDFVEGVGMLGTPEIASVEGFDKPKGPKLLPAAKTVPEGV